MAGKEGEMSMIYKVVIFALCKFFSLLLLNLYTFKEHDVTREKNNLKIFSLSFVSIILISIYI